MHYLLVMVKKWEVIPSEQELTRIISTQYLLSNYKIYRKIMKKYILVFSLAVASGLSAQVGVNTSNPQQVLHIDGRSTTTTANPATGVPTAAQQADDVVVSEKGYLVVP